MICKITIKNEKIRIIRILDLWHKSRLWNNKNHCVWSHGMQNSRCALTRRTVVLNICTLNFIGYLYFMQIFIPLCMTHNCGLHNSNYVSNTFKVVQGEW